ncbi:MAG: hypothetical protein ACXVEF_32715 [Polyangiales bacterium]
MFGVSKSKSIRIALACATLVASSLPLACATPTETKSEWKDPSRVAKPMEKIVVIGLHLKPEQRRLVEDQLAASLERKGMQVTASYRVLGDLLPDSDTGKSTLQRAGYQGALIVSLRGVEDRRRYIPKDVWAGPYFGYYDAGYMANETIVTFDSALFDLRDGKRAWTLTTETTNPSSGADSAKSLSKEVVSKLSDLGFVAH